MKSPSVTTMRVPSTDAWPRKMKIKGKTHRGGRDVGGCFPWRFDTSAMWVNTKFETSFGGSLSCGLWQRSSNARRASKHETTTAAPRCISPVTSRLPPPRTRGLSSNRIPLSPWLTLWWVAGDHRAAPGLRRSQFKDEMGTEPAPPREDGQGGHGAASGQGGL